MTKKILAVPSSASPAEGEEIVSSQDSCAVSMFRQPPPPRVYRYTVFSFSWCVCVFNHVRNWGLRDFYFLVLSCFYRLEKYMNAFRKEYKKGGKIDISYCS